MSLKKTSGFVIKSTTVSETDSIIHLLGEDGIKSKFKIKGIKKSKSRPIVSSEIGSQISIDYYSHEKNEISNIKEVSVIDRFDKLKSNYTGFLILTYIAELVDAIIPENYEQKQIYELFQKAILTLNEEKVYFQFLPFFKIRLLHLLGLLSREQNCSVCGEDLKEIGSASIHYQNLEFICKNCVQITKEQIGLIFLIDYLFKNRYINIDFTKTSNSDIFELDRILNDYLRIYLNKELKSFKILYHSIGGQIELLD